MINDKALVLANALYFIQKGRVSAQVRQAHLAKNDKKCDLTEELETRFGTFETWLNEQVEDYVKSHPAYPWFSKVKGIGNLNIGKVMSMVDIEKADKISRLWRYAGFACDSEGRAERLRKGEKLHFNKVLKSMCWRLGKSLIRAKGKYYDFYLKQKTEIAQKLKDRDIEIVPSAELPKESGKHVEKDGYFGLGHVDQMAFRKMIKLFLSHLWLEWRQAEGLEVTLPYAHAIKGHSSLIRPEEMIG